MYVVIKPIDLNFELNSGGIYGSSTRYGRLKVLEKILNIIESKYAQKQQYIYEESRTILKSTYGTGTREETGQETI